jgi:hypothetical protein
MDAASTKVTLSCDTTSSFPTRLEPAAIALAMGIVPQTKAVQLSRQTKFREFSLSAAPVLSEAKKPKADAEEVRVREGLAPGSLDA